VLVLGALAVPFLRGNALKGWVLALPLLSYAHLLLGFDIGFVSHAEILAGQLTPVRVDRLSMVWGHIFHIAAFLGALFALHVDRRLEHLAALSYAGSAIGAAFAGDLLTLFVWWELTAVTSVWIVLNEGGWTNIRTAIRYMIVQVASGVLLLAGTIFRIEAGEGMAFDEIGLTGSLDTTLIFLAFGIKAAFPFLHNWLQDSYPKASATGTVFLSAFTTKLAIYALARAFPGTEILIPIGAVMTLFPIFFAVLENDLRKVLAYSLNNQLGFMIVGVGIGTELSINGTAAHAFAHILYKALLFMSMGAVLDRVGSTKATDLGGLYKSMPLTTLFCLVGAVSISGFPLFSGFVSKSMIVSATGEGHYTGVYLALLFASAGVLHHSGIKIPFFAFFGHDSGKRPPEARWNMLAAMAIASAFCFGIGVAPGVLYSILPYPSTYVPYTADHIVTMLQLLFGATFAFALLNRIGAEPPEEEATILDFDWFYRVWLYERVVRVRDFGFWMWQVFLRELFAFVDRRRAWVVRHAQPGGRWNTATATGNAVLSVAVLLTLYALLFFGSGDPSIGHGDAHGGGHHDVEHSDGGQGADAHGKAGDHGKTGHGKVGDHGDHGKTGAKKASDHH
jgi:multicomponent Na+:H+ antiporter subunit D